MTLGPKPTAISAESARDVRGLRADRLAAQGSQALQRQPGVCGVRRLIAAALLVCAASPVVAQDLVFDIGPTLSCLDRTQDFDLRHGCIGEAANRCMEASEGGYSTIGMSGCMDAELQYWDARLNVSYQELMGQERADDAELAGTSAPAKAPALLAMQRAWIPFRDASCDYERAQWGGGTGGGPATVGCLLRMTAEQTLYLEAVRLGE